MIYSFMSHCTLMRYIEAYNREIFVHKCPHFCQTLVLITITTIVSYWLYWWLVFTYTLVAIRHSFSYRYTSEQTKSLQVKGVGTGTHVLQLINRPFVLDIAHPWLPGCHAFTLSHKVTAPSITNNTWMPKFIVHDSFLSFINCVGWENKTNVAGVNILHPVDERLNIGPRITSFHVNQPTFRVQCAAFWNGVGLSSRQSLWA